MANNEIPRKKEYPHLPDFKKDCVYTISGKELVHTKCIGLRWYFKSVKSGKSYYMGVDEKLVNNNRREYIKKELEKVKIKTATSIKPVYTKEQMCQILGCSMENLKCHFAENAKVIKKMYDKAITTGKKVNGYAAEQLLETYNYYIQNSK